MPLLEEMPSHQSWILARRRNLTARRHSRLRINRTMYVQQIPGSHLRHAIAVEENINSLIYTFTVDADSLFPRPDQPLLHSCSRAALYEDLLQVRQRGQ